MVRNIAQRENKRVNFEYNHHDVKIDRKILSKLGSILNHLIRNAIYHGIESESDRKKAHKNPDGIIVLDSRIENNVLFISVSDDGNGVDPDSIARKAIEKGIYTEDQIDEMEDEEIINIIFEPSFSTASEADLTSGRGLGLNIVKQMVESLAGHLRGYGMENGTQFSLQIPGTSYFNPCLLIRHRSDTFCIPLDDIQNLTEVSSEDIKIIGDKEYIIMTEAKQLLPLYRLSSLFHTKSYDYSDSDDNKQLHKSPTQRKLLRIVHIKKGSKNYALEVDEFLKETEIVIKRIDDLPTEIKGFSGAAILDDGAVSLIIDPFSLVN